MEDQQSEHASQKSRGKKGRAKGSKSRKYSHNKAKQKSHQGSVAAAPPEWVGRVPQNFSPESSPTLKNYFPHHVGTDNISDVDFYCILDFEATCDNTGKLPKKQSEVIEFPSVLIDVRSGVKKASVVSEFQRYCRPELHPQLYPFCTELTGITQEMVDGGIPFRQALIEHSRWLASHLNEDGDPDGQPVFSAVIVTCGAWDLSLCLPNQLELIKMSVNGIPSVYNRWINIKTTFEQSVRKKGGGMTGMLNECGLPLTGRHHSGIDDSRNIANILLYLICSGALPEQNISIRY